MRLLTAGAALTAALLTGGVPAVALIAADPPATEERPAKTGNHGAHAEPPNAGSKGAHGNPHGPDHAAKMKRYAEQHAEAMQTWGPCMESLDSTGEQEPSRAEKLDACGSKPTPPGHRGNEHAGHQAWHKFHVGSDQQARPGNR